jgi:fucose 4-O-acetylase-like acetyltransferase
VYTERFVRPDARGPWVGQLVGRQAWIDNLRVAVIVGVIAAHVSTAYILDVDWYYMERTAAAVSETVLTPIVWTGLLFGMGLLFLVAGLFTPPAFARKGPRGFALGRLMRLGLPLAVFVIVFEPLTDFVGYRGMGGDDGFIAYLDRWRREDADLSVMWFVAALLAFSLVYAAWRLVRPARHDGVGRLGAAQLVGFGAFIAVGSFLVRLVWPFASNSVFGLNLWEFPQMMAMFGLGALAAEHGWLGDALPDRFWRNCGLAAVAGGVMLLGILGAIRLGADEDAFLGGLNPQALALPITEAIIAVGMSLWALDWFRRRWERAGPLARALGRASFAAYIVHAPVVVLLSVGLSSVPVPVEIKFLAVFALGAAASFGLGWLVTRWRFVARIL